MLTIKIPEHSNGFFYVMADGVFQELLSCYSHNPAEINIVIDMVNEYNEKRGGKAISSTEAAIIKLDLQIRDDKSTLKTKEENLARMIEELEQEKEQEHADDYNSN